MMKRTMALWLCGLMLGWMAGIGSARAEITGCSPKIDNFILFVDQSGSMYQPHRDAKEIKELLVKKALTQMNDQIPQLGYKGGLYLFAPFAQRLPMGPYSRASMAAAIASIPDDQPVIGRTTPMGQGIADLSQVVGGLGGKTAVILLSDGEQNEGPDPVVSAQQLLSAHPDLCIHVVSFADTAYGIGTNLQVAAFGRCLYAEGTEFVAGGPKLEQFVREVFCGAPMKQKLVLRGVNFDFDKSTIQPEGKPVLDEAIRALNEQPNVRISVEGHTDAIGSDAYNQRLSERRAQAVVDYLAAGGVARSRMTARGFGESRPVASNDTADGRAQNRRVEFGLMSK